MTDDRSRIRRGAKPRKAVAAKPRGRNLPAKRTATQRALDHVPIDSGTIQRIATWGTLGLLGAVLIGALQMLGVPAMAGIAVAEATGRAGFEVKRVELKGIDRMDRLTVYGIAFDQHSMAMPLVDLDKVRDSLLRYGWIKDARVSRRLPDTLVVDIVERKPAAIWQNKGRLALIDADGTVLEDISVAAMPDLPLLIGPDANLHSRSLAALVSKAPALKPVMAGAAWVGGRRWDLRFQSGEVLALPEGDAEAVKAIEQFARIDAAQRLLGRGFVRFDMRDPTRMVARVGKDIKAIDDATGQDQGQEQGAPAATTGIAKVSDSI